MAECLLTPLLDAGDQRADDQRAAFRALLDEIFPDDAEVLDRLMARFDRLDRNDHAAFAVLQYEAGYSFTFNLTISENESESAFTSLNSATGALSGECGGGGNLGYPGWSDLEDFLEEAEDFAGEPVMAFDVGQNIMIGDRSQLNERNEPTLYFIDHEDGEPARLAGAESLSALQVYLRVLVQHLDDGAAFFDDVDG